MESYLNEKKTGTRGLELEYKWKAEKWFAMINYSFATTAGHSTIPEYSVPGILSTNLAFPEHKFNFMSNWNLLNGLWVSPFFTITSKRYGSVTHPDSLILTYPTVLYANINFSLENFLFKGLTAQASVFNIFNQNRYYIQPYNNNHAGLPGAGREFQFRLNYRIFNK
jgi:outer membrane receptor for ferrienterochelin and colicin